MFSNTPKVLLVTGSFENKESGDYLYYSRAACLQPIEEHLGSRGFQDKISQCKPCTRPRTYSYTWLGTSVSVVDLSEVQFYTRIALQPHLPYPSSTKIKSTTELVKQKTLETRTFLSFSHIGKMGKQAIILSKRGSIYLCKIRVISNLISLTRGG